PAPDLRGARSAPRADDGVGRRAPAGGREAGAGPGGHGHGRGAPLDRAPGRGDRPDPGGPAPDRARPAPPGGHALRPVRPDRLPLERLPGPRRFRTTASISVGAQIPIFTGGRIYADELVARADLRESRARLEQLRDFAAEDAFDTIERVNAARATFEATGSTVQEAERAYAIAELRYREGVASLLELTDTRLLLEEALANRAVAARDLQVALTRLALLPALPLEGLPGTVVDFTTGPAGAVTGAAGAVIDAAGTTSGIAPGRA